jgi:hypothetical protein
MTLPRQSIQNKKEKKRKSLKLVVRNEEMEDEGIV